MQRNFYTDDFERLIRQKADQYKMYPSDKVWKGVYRSLHGRRKWRWAGLAVLLLGIGLYTSNWYLSDSPVAQIARNLQPSITAANQPAGETAASAPFRWADATNPNISTNYTNKAATDNLAGSSAAAQTATAGNPRQGQFNSFLAFDSEQNQFFFRNEIEELQSLPRSIEVNIENPAAQESTAKAGSSASSSLADAASESVLDENTGNKVKGVNWLQDYAVFQLTAPKQKKLGLQLYFSPTVNYRKLSGTSYFPSSEVKNIPLSPALLGDVDQYVKHKPALGFEMGANLLYRTSKRVSFKAGLQFNYSRYTIEAYTGLPEIATIALNNSSAYITDTISSYSSIRNLSGMAEENLSNQYFQVSMPVGLEFRLIGTDKFALNVAGTVQPTYLLNRNTYMITTDYKNYMREPSLVRRWNINGGLETYISYHTGTVRWQVGPQFRYQLLSSYVRKYPIREQLMEYGFKIGVSKMIR